MPKPEMFSMANFPPNLKTEMDGLEKNVSKLRADFTFPTTRLGGGCKYVLISPLLGEDFQFD